MNIQTPSPLTLTAAILLAATLLSCNKETVTPLDTDDTITVSVETLSNPDGSSTRTSISNLATQWSEGDSIKLFDSDGHSAVYEFHTAASGEPGKATFARKRTVGSFNWSNFSAAFYPAEYVTSYNTGTTTFTAAIPDTLQYSYTSPVGSLRAPMASNNYDPSTKTLTFANAFAVVDVAVFGPGTVTSVNLTSSTDKLTGNFTFALSGTNSIAVTAPSSGGTETVSLKCAAGITLGANSSEPTHFYIPIPGSVTANSRLTAKLNLKDSNPVASKSMSVTVKSSGSLNVLAQNTLLKMSINTNKILLLYVDEYGNDNGPGTLINGVIWAPVNCGYHPTNYPYGKLYQWGRKVGGGYKTASGATTDIAQSATAATYTDNYNKSPEDSKFYYQASEPYDWYTNSSGTQLSAWPMKSTDSGYVADKIANPCPSGWRVPTLDELGSLCYTDWNSSNHSGTTTRGEWDSTNKGWKFSDRLFLPAAGYRSGYSGSANDRGSFGGYWSSSVNGAYARYLYFSSGGAYLSSNYRAFGDSVRCVQE